MKQGAPGTLAISLYQHF